MFASHRNVWTMSDTMNIFNSFHEPLKGIMAPKIICIWISPKMERLEIEIFKIYTLIYFLPKFLIEILQFMMIRQIGSIITLNMLILYSFSQKIIF